MKLTNVEVTNYRSLFDLDDQHFTLPLSDGMNTLIGPNNCGKSNVLKAIAAAMDPDFPYLSSRDKPAHMRSAVPKVTLTFKTEAKSPVDKTLLRYAKEYERSIRKKGKTFADAKEVRLHVSFKTNGDREYRLLSPAGAIQGDAKLRQRAVDQLFRAVRFVYVESGQSLEDLLSGRFSEILRTVIREHLRDEFKEAEASRKRFIEELQEGVLDPLRARVADLTHEVFPEVEDAELVPRVPGIEQILSNVDVQLADAATTPLADKGTGVRGAVLVAMLRYLAIRSRRSVIFAVEEPEAFLHPGAQEELSEALESLAERSDVTLLVTTHSPFIPSREPKAQLVGLTKDEDGRTIVREHQQGNEPPGRIVSSLFRDPGIPMLLDAAAAIPRGTKGILVVEGTSDVDFIEVALDRTGNAALLGGLHIVPATGAESAVAQTLLLQSHTKLPIVALFDSDEPGRSGRDRLKKKFGFPSKRILEYGKRFDPYRDGAEAEDLFPPKLWQRFVEERGESTVVQAKQALPGGGWRYELKGIIKDEIRPWLESNAKPSELGMWVDLVMDARRELGMD